MIEQTSLPRPCRRVPTLAKNNLDANRNGTITCLNFTKLLFVINKFDWKQDWFLKANNLRPDKFRTGATIENRKALCKIPLLNDQDDSAWQG